jgi:hypothetical protein
MKRLSYEPCSDQNGLWWVTEHQEPMKQNHHDRQSTENHEPATRRRKNMRAVDVDTRREENSNSGSFSRSQKLLYL